MALSKRQRLKRKRAKISVYWHRHAELAKLLRGKFANAFQDAVADPSSPLSVALHEWTPEMVRKWCDCLAHEELQTEAYAYSRQYHSRATISDLISRRCVWFSTWGGYKGRRLIIMHQVVNLASSKKSFRALREALKPLLSGGALGKRIPMIGKRTSRITRSLRADARRRKAEHQRKMWPEDDLG